MQSSPSQVPIQPAGSQDPAQNKPSILSRIWPACKWAIAAAVLTGSSYVVLIFAALGLIVGPQVVRAQRWRPTPESSGDVIPAPAWAARLGRLWTRGLGWAALVLGPLWIFWFALYRSPLVWIGGAAIGAGFAAVSGTWRSFGSAIAIPRSLAFAQAITFGRRWRALLVVSAAALAALQLTNTFNTLYSTQYRRNYQTPGGIHINHNGDWAPGYGPAPTSDYTPYFSSETGTDFGSVLLGLMGFVIAFHIRRTPAGLEPVRQSVS